MQSLRDRLMDLGLYNDIIRSRHHEETIKPGRYRVATLPLNVKQSREIGIAVKKGFLPSTITQLFLQHVVDYTKDIGEITVIRH